MGALSGVGAAIGGAFAGPATASGAAGAALGWQTLSTGFDVAGSLLSSHSAAKDAAYKAGILRDKALTTRLAGGYDEQAQKLKTGADVASARASAAAHGVDVGSGAVLNTQAAIRSIGDLDAAMIHYNTARDAYAYEEEARQARKSAKSSTLGGILRAGTSFLSGAASLGDKWTQFKQAGALTPAGAK